MRKKLAIGRTPRTGSDLDLTAPWKIDFSDNPSSDTDPEAERRRQMDGLMALLRSSPEADAS